MKRGSNHTTPITKKGRKEEANENENENERNEKQMKKKKKNVLFENINAYTNIPITPLCFSFHRFPLFIRLEYQYCMDVVKRKIIFPFILL